MLIYVKYKNNSITLGKAASYLNIEERKEERRKGAEQKKMYSATKTVKVIDKKVALLEMIITFRLKCCIRENSY